MIDRDHRANFQCSAKGCMNTRDQGLFVGRFCAPCDAAVVTGEAKNGTSWIFAQAARIRELEAKLVEETKEAQADDAEIRKLESDLDNVIEFMKRRCIGCDTSADAGRWKIIHDHESSQSENK